MHQIGEKVRFDGFYKIVNVILVQSFLDLDHLRNGGSENQSRRFKWACQIVCSTTAFFSFAVVRQEIFICFDFKESILLPNDFHLTYL